MNVVPGDARRLEAVSPERWTLSRSAARRLRADRIVRWVVSAGGFAIIASILGILLFILIEVWPLLSGATVDVTGEFPLSGSPVMALLSDEHRTHLALLDAAGNLRILRTPDGKTVLESSLVPPAAAASKGADGSALPGGSGNRILDARAWPAQGLITAATSDGNVILARVTWDVSFEDERRVITPRLDDPIVIRLDPAGAPVTAHAAMLGEGGSLTVAGQLDNGTLAVVRRESREDFLTGETLETETRSDTPLASSLSRMILDEVQRRLYAGTQGGKLFSWPVTKTGLGPADEADAGGSPVTALSLLIGDRSLVVGQSDGALSVWFRVPQEEGGFVLQRIRDFPPHPGPLRLIAPSLRDKGFLAQDESGRLGLYYSTSHRTLWTGPTPVDDASALAYAPKADGAFVAGARALASLDIHNPHPQTSLRALFGRVWYEGHPEPGFVWQSSSATDGFEPKLSLTPLLIGTLKGTLYSLLLAIPLAVLGAMYASHFMHPGLQKYVKPTIEIMAALPSVVLGFLAGLWLAPRVEKLFPALLLMVLVLPALILGTGSVLRRLQERLGKRMPIGIEVIPFMIALALGIWVCIGLSEPLEAWAFGGDFRVWLSKTTGLAYDQRNAIIVGMAMGFAVIPIIFSISEDAFSNVPQNLISGSLALGASRWQTVTRVVLPTASPGIFSAVMIGFGRAVGETMIVLMATGNTPIMDWSPFNGFRTLSANIAVEIPEAPQGDTLYRTLFLAALLLFVVTFVLNTAAEIVRQRLRRRYAQI